MPRYAEHVSQYDSECAIHLLQTFVLELPPACLLYFPLRYYDNLQQAVKKRVAGKLIENLWNFTTVNLSFSGIL